MRNSPTSMMLCVLAVAGAALVSGAAQPPAPAATQANRDAVRAGPLELMGTNEPTREQVRDMSLFLAQKRQLVVITLAGKRARLQGLQRRTAALETQLEKAIAEDEALAALLKTLPLLVQQVALAQGGRSSPLEVALRSYDVSNQHVRLAERRETIRRRVQGGLWEELSRARVDAEADVEDLEAQLAAVDMQLAQTRELGRE